MANPGKNIAYNGVTERKTMFRRFGKEKPSIYDAPINRVLDEMSLYGPDTEEYPKLVKHLKSLTRMKAATEPTRRISPDTLAVVGGNLLGILIIVMYEQRHVMVSKGMGFILRPRS